MKWSTEIKLMLLLLLYSVFQGCFPAKIIPGPPSQAMIWGQLLAGRGVTLLCWEAGLLRNGTQLWFQVSAIPCYLQIAFHIRVPGKRFIRMIGLKSSYNKAHRAHDWRAWVARHFLAQKNSIRRIESSNVDSGNFGTTQWMSYTSR